MRNPAKEHRKNARLTMLGIEDDKKAVKI